MYGIDLSRLPRMAYDNVAQFANYLGRKVCQLPTMIANTWEEDKLLVIGAIVVVIVLICFWEIGLVLCGTLAGKMLGNYFSPWLGHDITHWCSEVVQEYSPWFVVAALIALSLAAEYLIVCSAVDGAIGFIKGVGERYIPQGGQPGGNIHVPNHVIEDY